MKMCAEKTQSAIFCVDSMIQLSSDRDIEEQFIIKFLISGNISTHRQCHLMYDLQNIVEVNLELIQIVVFKLCSKYICGSRV